MMFKTFLFLTALVGLCLQSQSAAAVQNPQLRPINNNADANAESNSSPRIHTLDNSHRRLARDRLTPAPSASVAPSLLASAAPSLAPSGAASASPSVSPSSVPSDFPSNAPSSLPSAAPSKGPSQSPSSPPSMSAPPSEQPSISRTPVASPSSQPSSTPSISNAPTVSAEPSAAPTTKSPTATPTVNPTVAPTFQPSIVVPTNSVVALLGFNFAYSMSDSTTMNQDELTTTLEDYLTEGMLQEYPNAVAVTLQQRSRRTLGNLRRQLQESSTVDYSGFVVFSGTAPALQEVQELQQDLLDDTASVQAALDANPSIGESVVVEKVAFDAVNDNGTGDGEGGDDNNAAIIGGVIGGSVLTLAAVALLMTRRRTNPLEDDADDDDDTVPPPPPPRSSPKDVAGDLQVNGTKTTAAAVPENMDPIIPASPNRTRQQQQTDVDYDLQPSPSAAPANGNMPAGAAAYTMRTTTPQKTAEVTTAGNMVAVSPITPARSVDSDDMDGYSLGPGSSDAANNTSTYSPVKNKNKVSATVAEITEGSDDEDEYNSDNEESIFTYGNVGNDTSVIGAGASVLGADSTVVDEYDNEDEPGHLSIKKSAYGGQARYHSPTKTDNADVAAGNGNLQPDDSGQPFDEASDDMDQDLDAFAVELERAKAAAKYLKASESSSPSSVKSDFAKNREAFEKSSKAKTIGRAPFLDGKAA